VREPCATCEMGYVRAIYVLVMRLFLVHIDRHTLGFGNHRSLLGDPGASAVTADDVDVALGAVNASRCMLKLTEINNVVERAGHKSQRGE